MVIKTFAFFDLETSGLPDYDCFKTKITELSIVAAPVEQFLLSTKEKVPRIQHKLTICLNPAKRIDDKASTLSGLDNYMLENEKKFTKKTAELISSFFDQLQSPICLVAHNGNGLDFPVLKKELNAFEIYLEDMLCLDSLPAFRDIEKRNNDKTPEQNGTSQDVTTIISDAEKVTENGFIESKNSTTIIPIESDPLAASEKIDWQKLNEETPKRLIKSVNFRSTKTAIDSTLRPQTFNATPSSSKNDQANKRNHPSSRRSLFPEVFKKGEFTLSSIYKRYYGIEPVNAHNAEADVIALMKCAIAVKDDFIKYAETEAKSFRDVKQLGKK